jgi:hypothetical protein
MVAFRLGDVRIGARDIHGRGATWEEALADLRCKWIEAGKAIEELDAALHPSADWIRARMAEWRVPDEAENAEIRRLAAEREATRGDSSVELDDAMRKLGFDPSERPDRLANTASLIEQGELEVVTPEELTELRRTRMDLPSNDWLCRCHDFHAPEVERCEYCGVRREESPGIKAP